VCPLPNYYYFMKYDLIVVGGGPAGYVGAIRAAQLGKKSGLCRKERAGGTCLNWGCIPTKSLLRNAELFHSCKSDLPTSDSALKSFRMIGPKIISRSRSVADKLAGGV